jgi:hypothetical protein
MPGEGTGRPAETPDGRILAASFMVADTQKLPDAIGLYAWGSHARMDIMTSGRFIRGLPRNNSPLRF